MLTFLVAYKPNEQYAFWKQIPFKYLFIWDSEGLKILS